MVDYSEGVLACEKGGFANRVDAERLFKGF